MEPDKIIVRGAAEHNLKNVTVEIPKKKLVVFTGVSGSGKSSLAFDTIYAEGQRRYVESLSSYARQFLGQMEKPRYDSISGLSPTISIEQKAASRNPRSTVGTITEVYDYLRVLFARTGDQHCSRCRRPVSAQTADQIVDEILKLPAGAKFTLLAPLIVNKKGEHRDIIEEARAEGFTRARIDGLMQRLDEEIKLEKNKKHTIELVVDRLVAKDGVKSRLTDSVETCLKFGEGLLTLAVEGERERTLSEHLACTACGLSFPELSHQSFSFNSPLGMCEDCNGLGTSLEMDPDKIVPDPDVSIAGGAIQIMGESLHDPESWAGRVFWAAAKSFGIDVDRPWKKLTETQRQFILTGSNGRTFKVSWARERGAGEFTTEFEGVASRLLRRFKETQSESARQYYAQFLEKTRCSTCGGTRLRPESLAVLLAGRSIADVCSMTTAQALDFFGSLTLTGNKAVIAKEILKEITNRLSFLVDVGLSYLTLDRAGPSLSGGEAQRIRLASQIGSELTGVLYILDEPSIGLHQRDNIKLLSSLQHLRDIGNSVIVVEHDRETIENADWIIDFGPGAGVLGGEVVAAGTPAEIVRASKSLTGRYLGGVESIGLPANRRAPRGWLEIVGAAENNLKNIDVRIPLGVFASITGVSGAGKSSLIKGILHPALANRLHGARETVGRHQEIRGLEELDKVIHISQDPIGRTPRSNPSTYTKVFDPIRDLFASLKESRIHGFHAGRFSFNVKGGRCEACEGGGVVKVEMHFLADVYVPCEVCKGKRFNEATLRVRYKDRSIADVLDLTLREALGIFENIPRIRRVLETLMDVGLDYVQLGQPSPTLSGGEAQRVKLARELARRETGRTLYILDEPTTGLHFDDIRKLISVLNRLVEGGNSVLVIEHNLDVIKTADYLVDLGPEGGDLGGRVVAEGPPEEVARHPDSHTGRYLGPLIGDLAARPRSPVAAARSRAVSGPPATTKAGSPGVRPGSRASEPRSRRAAPSR